MSEQTYATMKARLHAPEYPGSDWTLCQRYAPGNQLQVRAERDQVTCPVCRRRFTNPTDGERVLQLVAELATVRTIAAAAPHEPTCATELRGCFDDSCKYRHWTSGSKPTHQWSIDTCPRRTLVCDCWHAQLGTPLRVDQGDF